MDTSSLLQDNNAPIVVSRDKLPVLDHFRFRYFLICPLLTYCCPRYIFFAQDGRRKGACRKRKWSKTGSLLLLPCPACAGLVQSELCVFFGGQVDEKVQLLRQAIKRQTDILVQVYRNNNYPCSGRVSLT